MDGSGLKVLELVFASNTGTYIMSSKAIARILWRHFMDSAFHPFLLADTLGFKSTMTPVETEGECVSTEESEDEESSTSVVTGSDGNVLILLAGYNYQLL